MRTAAALAVLLVTVVASAELPPDCRFGAGALPEETLPAGLPHGDQIPIDHILVLMQENRSFDHYFSQLNRQNVDRARKTMSNPDPTGGPPIHPFHQKEYCEVADLNHEKTDRASLSALFTELALRLNQDFKIPGDTQA